MHNYTCKNSNSHSGQFPKVDNPEGEGDVCIKEKCMVSCVCNLGSRMHDKLWLASFFLFLFIFLKKFGQEPTQSGPKTDIVLGRD